MSAHNIDHARMHAHLVPGTERNGTEWGSNVTILKKGVGILG